MSGWKGLLWFSLTFTPERRWLMNSGRLSGCCRMISAPVTAWTLAGICAAGTPKPGRGVTPMISTAGVSSCSAGFSAQTAPRASAKPARDRISDAPVRSRFRIGLLVQARDVMREILDVLLGDGLGDAGHAAGVVGARARLEGFELLDHVLGMLAGDARNLVLPGESSQMAHGAQDLVGLLLAAGDARRVGPEGDGLRVLRGEVLGEIEHVLGGELRHGRRHRGFAAPAFLEVFQLKVEIAGGLAREHRKLGDHRVAVGAMAGGAGLRLALARGEIGVRRREESEEKGQGKRPFHPTPQKIKGRPRAASQDRNDQGRANTTTLLPRLKSICVFSPAASATHCLFFTMEDTGGALTSAPAWYCHSTPPVAASTP